MKTLRQMFVGMILSLTLAVSVLAGHIDTPGAPVTAPTPATGSTIQTSNTLPSFVLSILSLIYR